MNICSYKEFQKADEALNDIWPLVRDHMKQIDTYSKEYFPEQANGAESLLKAQRAWIIFRDAHCDTEGARFAGGSIRPLIENGCRESLTLRRIEELKGLMEEG